MAKRKTADDISKQEIKQKELQEYYNEIVPLVLVRDKRNSKDDLTVTLNGINYQIKRGVPVSVPRGVALVVERARQQEYAAEKYIDSLSRV